MVILAWDNYPLCYQSVCFENSPARKKEFTDMPTTAETLVQRLLSEWKLFKDAVSAIIYY